MAPKWLGGVMEREKVEGESYFSLSALVLAKKLKLGLPTTRQRDMAWLPSLSMAVFPSQIILGVFNLTSHPSK